MRGVTYVSHHGQKFLDSDLIKIITGPRRTGKSVFAFLLLKSKNFAYLVFSLNRFSFKMKEQIKAPRKIYLVDNGFIAAKVFQFFQNTGKLKKEN